VPVLRRLALALFVAVWVFAALSASLAEALGLVRVRMVGFAAVVAALALVGLLAHPRMGSRGRALALVLLALHWLQTVAHPLAPFDPVAHKILVVLLVLLCAPNIAIALGGADLPRVFTWLLALFVPAALAFWALGDVRLHAYADVVRVDVTGSVVSQASLAVLGVLAFLARLVHEPRRRMVWLPLLALALVLLLASATRTALLTLVLFAAYDVLAGPARVRLRVHLLAVLPALAVFALFTLTVSDALWKRLVGAGTDDWTSGRAQSLAWWVATALEHPLGLGIGAVRRMFADGRPVVDGGLSLEWPHNAFVRLWVEGGLPGLAFALLLIGGLVVRAVRAARVARDGPSRLVLLALAADMTAQSLLQNYLQSIYLSTATILTIAVLAVQVRHAAANAATQPRAQAPAPSAMARGIAGGSAA